MIRVAAALALLIAATPAAAGCRLALALAFDVSNSVDDSDYGIQKQGVLAALRDPGIRAAFLDPDDHVALAVFEWSGRHHQEMVLDWTEITGADALDQAISVLDAHDRLPVRLPTGLGSALDFARELFDQGPNCAATVLDVSGDGRNNQGPTPARIYAREDFGRLTVNALAIGGHEADIFAYYADEVLRGPGAFVVEARTHLDFPPMIRMKLERELGIQLFGALPQASEPPG